MAATTAYQFAINIPGLLSGLMIMLKGMIGIFVVMGLIYLTIVILVEVGKVNGKKTRKSNDYKKDKINVNKKA